jgi:hypothetical protein
MADEHPHEYKVVESSKVFNVADVPVRRTEGFTRIYANNATLAATFFDMSITFGEVMIEANSSPSIEQRLAVTMSMEHAKALAVAMLEHLASYEKANGVIRAAPPMTTPNSN